MSDKKSSQVTVYSAEWCGFCKMVKAYLESKKVAFKEVNVEQEPDGAAWIEENTGQRGIPVTVFSKSGSKDHDIVIGFNREAIDGYLRDHKLV